LPYAELTEGRDGFLYGTASGGSILFKVAKDGTGFTPLRQFQCHTDGCESRAGLIEGTDGMLYGTNTFGGAHLQGTVFRVGKDGQNFTILTALLTAVIPMPG
jgi:uncharacterized repeat protein (TIGR03803 family)